MGHKERAEQIALTYLNSLEGNGRDEKIRILNFERLAEFLKSDVICADQEQALLFLNELDVDYSLTEAWRLADEIKLLFIEKHKDYIEYAENDGKKYGGLEEYEGYLLEIAHRSLTQFVWDTIIRARPKEYRDDS